MRCASLKFKAFDKRTKFEKKITVRIKRLTGPNRATITYHNEALSSLSCQECLGLLLRQAVKLRSIHGCFQCWYATAPSHQACLEGMSMLCSTATTSSFHCKSKIEHELVPTWNYCNRISPPSPLIWIRYCQSSMPRKYPFSWHPKLGALTVFYQNHY